MEQSDWKNKVAVSSGGIVYRRDEGQLVVAITARDGGKVWCLPKGLVEEGESLEDAALREVREETGLTAALEQKIGQIDYWFYWRPEATRFHKYVHFYLLRFVNGDIKDHDHEVEEVRWVSPSEALAMLTYDSERDILKKALALMQEAPKS